MSAAISRALTLDAGQRASRLGRDIEWCKANTATDWARTCLSDVAAATAAQHSTQSGSVGGLSGGLGLGFGWRPRRALGMDDGKDFTQLRDEAVLQSYHATSRRLIVLDHVGTLVPPFKEHELHGTPHDAPHGARSSPSSSRGSTSPNLGSLRASASSFPSLLAEQTDSTGGIGGIGGMGGMGGQGSHGQMSSSQLSESASTDGLHALGSKACSATSSAERARPRAPPVTSAVRNALEIVCADPRNTLIVMSTSSKEELAAAFGSVPGCSLGADNGMHVAWSGLHGRWEMAGGVAWERSDAMQQQSIADDGWQDLARTVVRTYAERTNGAYAESGANYVSFHFGQVAAQSHQIALLVAC